MTIFILALLIIAVLIFFVSIMLYLKSGSQYKQKAKSELAELFESKAFDCERVFVVNKHLIVALNKKANKLAVIEDFNCETHECKYYEIKTKFITSVERNGFLIKINYLNQANAQTLSVAPATKECLDFFHVVFRDINYKIIEKTYANFKFDISASSDWEASWVWAYDIQNCAFAYYCAKDKLSINLLNLRKTFLTLDLSYNHFELVMSREWQELSVYEKGFLRELFSGLLAKIKEHVTEASRGIYYDNYSNIIYLTNGHSLLQSVILEDVEEVFYRDNRISFTLLNDKKIVNFACDKEFMKSFEDFIIGYNLRKIANSFDYSVDKLLNVGQNTKFIVDFSRDRVVYCANLNKIQSFSYMTIAFSSLESAEDIRSGSSNYVRIKTKDGETLDVTCSKSEISQYIKAQIDIIIQEQNA